MTTRDDAHTSEFAVTHLSGRSVHVTMMGDPAVSPVVIYSHGFPACRLEALVARDSVRALGLCLIALDRPGSGGSSHYEGRTLTDWAEDVELVTNHLGVGRFHLLGVSGGGPFAVAAASVLGDRVRSLALVSAMAPTRLPNSLSGMNLMNRALIQLAHRSPRIAQAIVRGIATSWRMLPAVPVVWFGTLLPREDVAILNRRNVALIMGRTFKEALKPGVAGAVTDFGLMMSDWAHLLKRVTTPTRVWHGDADTYVPFSMGQVLSESISGARFMPIAGGGHFMVIDVLSEVLCDLVQADVGESTNPSLLKVPT